MILDLRNIKHHDDLATQHLEEIVTVHNEIRQETYPNTDQKTNYQKEPEKLRITSPERANDDIGNIGEEEGNKSKLLVPKLQVTLNKPRVNVL